MDIEMTTPQPADVVLVGPILLLLRRLERLDLLVDLLCRKGLVSETEIQSLNLEVMIRHAERTMRINDRQGKGNPKLEEAVSILRMELSRMKEIA